MSLARHQSHPPLLVASSSPPSRAPRALQSSRPPTSLATDRGFTLVEVIVALAIMAMSVIAFQRVVQAGAWGLAAGRLERDAVVLAKSQIESAGIAYPLEDGIREGASPTGHRWKVEMARRMPEGARGTAQRLAAYRVVVTIIWSEPSRLEPRTIEFATVKLRSDS